MYLSVPPKYSPAEVIKLPKGKYETFKEEVCAPAIDLNVYPTTLGRKIIDIAVKVVRYAGRLILKVP